MIRFSPKSYVSLFFSPHNSMYRLPIYYNSFMIDINPQYIGQYDGILSRTSFSLSLIGTKQFNNETMPSYNALNLICEALSHFELTKSIKNRADISFSTNIPGCDGKTNPIDVNNMLESIFRSISSLHIYQNSISNLIDILNRYIDKQFLLCLSHDNASYDSVKDIYRRYKNPQTFYSIRSPRHMLDNIPSYKDNFRHIASLQHIESLTSLFSFRTLYSSHIVSPIIIDHDISYLYTHHTSSPSRHNHSPSQDITPKSNRMRVMTQSGTFYTTPHVSPSSTTKSAYDCHKPHIERCIQPNMNSIVQSPLYNPISNSSTIDNSLLLSHMPPLSLHNNTNGDIQRDTSISSSNNTNICHKKHSLSRHYNISSPNLIIEHDNAAISREYNDNSIDSINSITQHVDNNDISNEDDATSGTNKRHNITINISDSDDTTTNMAIKPPESSPVLQIRPNRPLHVNNHLSSPSSHRTIATSPQLRIDNHHSHNYHTTSSQAQLSRNNSPLLHSTTPVIGIRSLPMSPPHSGHSNPSDSPMQRRYRSLIHPQQPGAINGYTGAALHPSRFLIPSSQNLPPPTPSVDSTIQQTCYPPQQLQHIQLEHSSSSISINRPATGASVTALSPSHHYHLSSMHTPHYANHHNPVGLQTSGQYPTYTPSTTSGGIAHRPVSPSSSSLVHDHNNPNNNNNSSHPNNNHRHHHIPPLGGDSMVLSDQTKQLSPSYTFRSLGSNQLQHMNSSSIHNTNNRTNTQTSTPQTSFRAATTIRGSITQYGGTGGFGDGSVISSSNHHHHHHHGNGTNNADIYHDNDDLISNNTLSLASIDNNCHKYQQKHQHTGKSIINNRSPSTIRHGRGADIDYNAEQHCTTNHAPWHPAYQMQQQQQQQQRNIISHSHHSSSLSQSSYSTGISTTCTLEMSTHMSFVQPPSLRLASQAAPHGQFPVFQHGERGTLSTAPKTHSLLSPQNVTTTDLPSATMTSQSHWSRHNHNMTSQHRQENEASSPRLLSLLAHGDSQSPSPSVSHLNQLGSNLGALRLSMPLLPSTEESKPSSPLSSRPRRQPCGNYLDSPVSPVPLPQSSQRHHCHRHHNDPTSPLKHSIHPSGNPNNTRRASVIVLLEAYEEEPPHHSHQQQQNMTMVSSSSSSAHRHVSHNHTTSRHVSRDHTTSGVVIPPRPPSPFSPATVEAISSSSSITASSRAYTISRQTHLGRTSSHDHHTSQHEHHSLHNNNNNENDNNSNNNNNNATTTGGYHETSYF